MMGSSTFFGYVVYRKSKTTITDELARVDSPDVALIRTLVLGLVLTEKITSDTVLSIHQISNNTFQNVQSCIRIQSTRVERKVWEIKGVTQHSSSYWSAINKTFPFWKIFLASNGSVSMWPPFTVIVSYMSLIPTFFSRCFIPFTFNVYGWYLCFSFNNCTCSI